MEKRIENIENQLEGMKELLIKLNDNIEIINKKMGSHIDFVEDVYDTVKHPLGYICNKVKSITGRNEIYSLTDISGN